MLLAPGAAHAQAPRTAPPAVNSIAPAGLAPAGLAPASLAAAIRSEVKLKPPAQLDGAEISPLRATSGPQLGDAMLCLKTLADGRTGFIAVFFEAGKVLSYRRAVAYDRCEADLYAQLVAAPRAKAVAAKPARAKPLPPGTPPKAAASAD